MSETEQPAAADRSALLSARCDTCAHSEAAEYVEWGDDERLAWRARYPLFCVRAEMRDGLPEDRQTLAFTMDGSSYRASLLVSPDFGCVMWTAKNV